MKRRLITSALPYVNNVPHLGNLIQVLSADVFARFCRLKGYDTLYICGTDEYGTATETKALEEGLSPKELCDRFFAVHRDIYAWFGIAFDKFGRTSAPEHTEITQSIFLDLDKNGYIQQQTIEQLHCDSCARFLADRYVRGVCPFCGYDGARGDQCENCGKLLEPTELKNPRCYTCGSTPHLKQTTHLYIDLPKLKSKLEPWLDKACGEGFWAKNAIQMTQAWLRDGLKPRAITRDLKWGIPVPKKGFENKVFYVWFDACIGYVSMTAGLGAERGFDWKSWWQNPEEVELFQFIGKDNIPFHTVIFPSSQLGTGRNWTMLHHMSSSEYLNYEAGKFSKSKGIGVFGTDVMETGIPADIWRFYIFWNRPETSDYTFTWADFFEKVNGELIGNLGNLANRTLSFISRFYAGKIPEARSDEAFWQKAQEIESRVALYLERADLRDALREIFQLSDLANKRFQDAEPWKTRNSDPEMAASLLSDLCYVLKDLAIMIQPFMPQAAEKLASQLGFSIGQGAMDWSDLGKREGLQEVKGTGLLFQKLEEEHINTLRERYSGSQKERAERDKAESKAEVKAAEAFQAAEPPKSKESKKPEETKLPPLAELAQEERCARLVSLKVAKIIKVERHPKADKLYIETLDDGSGQDRVIVSGLVPFYREEELLGKHIVLVDNLKPAKLRGVESRGMLLAASKKGSDGEGSEFVEILQAPWAEPGSAVMPEGFENLPAAEAQIDIDSFFSIPLSSKSGLAYAGAARLLAQGKPLGLEKVADGQIG
ncbi:MAG: methionine--tRNA ligase [Spirochaetia bacterium]|jgi:methionyl-tRNA synthetase|nr:methionine--tRNA ligase [Spirochaetia bacterium]